MAPGVAAALLLAGCDPAAKLESLHRHDGPPPVPPEILASASTGREWVGDPRPAPNAAGTIGVLVLWDGFDPRSIERMADVEAWYEAYARYGVRLTGLHFTRYPFGADSAVVGANARRLGVRIPTAVVAGAPPAALAAGRGPVLIWPGGGDPAPEWLATEADARAFEARMRRRLRELRPDAGFPADAGGIARETPPDPVRTLFLGTRTAGRGPIRGAAAGASQPFVSPLRPEQEGMLDTPVPVGWWTPHEEFLEAARGGAANLLAIRYDAGPVGLVMGPSAEGPSRVWVLQDEKWLDPAQAGADVHFDARGASYLEVDATRLYRIGAAGAHVLKLSPDAPGVRFYSFTFEAATPRS